MRAIAERLWELGARRIFIVNWKEAPLGGDAADHKGDVSHLLTNAERWSPETATTQEADSWGEPQPIQAALPDVQKLLPEMLPAPLRKRAVDIADRMSVPLEHVAIPMVIEIGALIGRKLAIKPKAVDYDWTVFPTLWGALVGNPGLLKTPAMNEGLEPIRRFEAEEQKKTEERKGFQGHLHKLKKEKLLKEIDKAFRDGQDTTVFEAEYEELEAKPRRYTTNEPTVAKLHELFAENPNGLLLIRDELSGLLARLASQGSEGDREYFLECFEPGASEFTQDRIARGTTSAARILSIVGGFTPSKLDGYLAQAFGQCGGNDGLFQRFQLMVYPDMTPWKPGSGDRKADDEARTISDNLFRKLKAFDAEALGNVLSNEDKSLFWVRFTPQAQERFNIWRDKLEIRLRDPNGDDDEILIEHLSKSRSLLPKIALIFHVCELLFKGSSHGVHVCEQCERMAELWCAFLESHARRIYFRVIERTLSATQELAAKIRGRKLEQVFLARDVKRKGWRGLTDSDTVDAALEYLVDAKWLRSEPSPPSPKGGQPTVRFRINPKLPSKDGSVSSVSAA